MSKREYQPYYIPKRGTRCCLCSVVFGPGSLYHSTLKEEERGVIQRQDFCPLCWNPHDHAGSLFWQGKTPRSAAVIVNDAERCARALELLRQYASSNDVLERSQAYVLALYLERRKHAAMRKELWEGTHLAALLYEVLESGEMIAVPRVPSDQLDIAKVQELVAKQLGLRREEAEASL